MKVTKTISPYGIIEYRNEAGLLHREDGPAKIYQDGTQTWWLNGQLHREDGPAAIYPDGSQSWWLNGEFYSHEEWLYKLSIQYKWKKFCEIN